MAYFSNGSEGECMENQCAKCIFGELSCPIALVQYNHNYSACNNKEARKILDTLINDNGDCSMYNEFENVLSREKNGEYPENKMQLKIRQLDKLQSL